MRLLLATESLPNPTTAPAASSSTSGATPWPSFAFEAGQCATAQPPWAIAATLVYSVAGRRAALVTVAGRELVRDGRLLDADPALRARVAATTDALRAWATAR